MGDIFDRRELLKILTGATFALQLPAAEPDAPVFFTRDEFAMLDTLTELVIPADDHSPGAHAARVAHYIDRSLAEAFLPEQRDSWRSGLSALNEFSLSLHHSPFNRSSPEQQVELLSRIAQNEEHPQTPIEHFFTRLKQTTVFVYYTSAIGIHQEVGYKGNVLLENYAGSDAA
jgi:glucoside 3-dehydrogenase (cytochrome c) hitch-hiker subunit